MINVRVNNLTILLEKPAVVLAYQLNEFIKTGHSHLKLLKPEVENLVHYLTTYTFIPLELAKRASFVSDSLSHSRARSKSLGVDVTVWPSNWAIDKPAFQKDLKRFISLTEQLAKLLTPPSTRSTPESTSRRDDSRRDEPRDSPNTSSESNPSNSSKAGTTRHTSTTSAEEAIYTHPIGPVNMLEDN